MLARKGMMNGSNSLTTLFDIGGDGWVASTDGNSQYGGNPLPFYSQGAGSSDAVEEKYTKTVTLAQGWFTWGWHSTWQPLETACSLSIDGVVVSTSGSYHNLLSGSHTIQFTAFCDVFNDNGSNIYLDSISVPIS